MRRPAGLLFGFRPRRGLLCRRLGRALPGLKRRTRARRIAVVKADIVNCVRNGKQTQNLVISQPARRVRPPAWSVPLVQIAAFGFKLPVHDAENRFVCGDLAGVVHTGAVPLGDSCSGARFAGVLLSVVEHGIQQPEDVNGVSFGLAHSDMVRQFLRRDRRPILPPCTRLKSSRPVADRTRAGDFRQARADRTEPCRANMKPTLELSMIVKDGAPVLSRCLNSVASFVDRILVGDTGSADDSVEIARGFGAEVIAVPWEKDFSRARNRVLAERRCDWILVLDADEMLDSAGGEQIRAVIENPHADGYHNWRWNYMRDTSTRLGFQSARPNPLVLEESRAYPAYVALPTTRLFRSHPDVYYEGCVHETVTKRLTALGMKTARAEFIVHHFGHAEDADDARQAKNDLYQELGERKLRANADDPQALIEMGLAELENSRRPAVALEYFERASRLSPQSAVASLFAGVCLIRLARIPEALQRLERCAGLGLRNAVYYQALGDANFHAGRYAEARAAYAEMAALGEGSPLSEAKQGASEVHLGAVDSGIRRMRQAVASAPAFAELYDILATGALLGGDVELAAQTAQARLRMGKTTEFHAQLAALLEAQLAAHKKARSTAACA